MSTRLRRVPDDVKARFIEERDAQSKAIAQLLGPIIERITALERRFDDLPSSSAALSKGADNGLLARLVSFEKRLGDLELRGISYEGTYQRSKSYRAGNAVTAGGSLWIALEPVDPGETPGNSEVWQLACKRGRDGKNASGVTHRGRTRDE